MKTNLIFLLWTIKQIMFWENCYVYFIKPEKIVCELLKFTVCIPTKVNKNKI